MEEKSKWEIREKSQIYRWIRELWILFTAVDTFMGQFIETGDSWKHRKFKFKNRLLAMMWLISAHEPTKEKVIHNFISFSNISL